MVKRILRRLRSQGGFSLVELLMAMTMLNVGILAIVAAFSSATVGIKRASRIGTATALADGQMELYRGMLYNSIALDATSVSSAPNSPYKCDSALGASCPNSTSSEITTTCSAPLPKECKAERAATGADGGSYLVDTYILPITPSSGSYSGRVSKLVTVVVRDSTSPYYTWVRQTSTFDQATG